MAEDESSKPQWSGRLTGTGTPEEESAYDAAIIRMQAGQLQALHMQIESERPTLRDQFAMAALTGLLAAGAAAESRLGPEIWRLADAMLDSRKPK